MMPDIPVIRESTITIDSGDTFYIPVSAQMYLLSLKFFRLKTKKYYPGVIVFSSLVDQKLIYPIASTEDGPEIGLTTRGVLVCAALKDRAEQRKMYSDFMETVQHNDVLLHTTLFDHERDKE